MFALLADEDFDRRILVAICRVALKYQVPIQLDRVVDVEALGVGASDANILEYASHDNYVVITHDRETMPGFANRCMIEDLPMAGLIVVSQFSAASAVAHAVMEKALDRAREDLGWHY